MYQRCTRLENEILIAHHGKTFGGKQGNIAHIGEERCMKYADDPGAMLLSPEIWEQLNDGVVKTVECLSVGGPYSRVPRGYLQDKWFVDEVRDKIVEKKNLWWWKSREAVMIPSQYIYSVGLIEEPKGDIIECQVATTTPSTAS